MTIRFLGLILSRYCKLNISSFWLRKKLYRTAHGEMRVLPTVKANVNHILGEADLQNKKRKGTRPALTVFQSVPRGRAASFGTELFKVGRRRCHKKVNACVY